MNKNTVTRVAQVDDIDHHTRGKRTRNERNSYQNERIRRLFFAFCMFLSFTDALNVFRISLVPFEVVVDAVVNEYENNSGDDNCCVGKYECQFIETNSQIKNGKPKR